MPPTRARPALRLAPHGLALCTLAASAAGCAGRPQPSAPTPTASPVPPSRPTPATTATVGRFAYLPGRAEYDVRTDATIDMTAGPAAERGRETVTTSARVSYDVAPADRAVALSGRVEGLTVQGSARVTGGSNGPAAPVSFRGTIDSRTARLDQDGAALGCLAPAGAAQTAALTLARETVVRLLASVSAGARWRDTVVTNTCRGPIAATVTTVARYEVTAVEGTRVRVRRETTVSVRGQGIAGGRAVTLSGGGSGDAAIELDAARGRLTRSDGESRLTITVTMPDGARQFSQQLRTQVRERNGA